MRDMRLGVEWDIPNIFPLHIRRNVTIKGSLEAKAFASLDFRYLSGKLVLEAGVWLTAYRLRLRGLTASHAPSFPFVATSPGAHVLFQDCVLHRISCVPLELVYDSIKAPALAGAEPAAGTGRTEAGAAAAPLPPPPVASPVPPASASDIELLRQYCFRTTAGGRECRPLALWLRDYAYEARLRRSAGVLGTGGFVLHARNTTLVCDYPVSENCMRDSGPEFCVTRELSRRQRQAHWRRGAAWGAVAAACTVAALVCGWWLLRRQLAAAASQALASRPTAPAATAAATAGDVRALLPGPAAATTIGPTLQWLAEVSAEAEAETAAAAAAAGYPCRRPLVRMPSAQSVSSWPAATVEADMNFARGSCTPSLSRTSTRNMEQGPGTGTETGTGPCTGPGPGPGPGGGPAVPGCPDQPQPESQPRLQARERVGGSGHAGAGPAGPAGGTGPAAGPAEMALEDLGRLFGTCEVVSVSGEGSGASSSVLRAAAETQERILHIRQTINGSGIAAAAAGGSGGDVYDHLEVTELLGSGTFGKVFQGFWHGTLVAVKLMVFPAALTGLGQLERMAAMEAAISSSLSHPNIVQTYTWRVTPLLDASPLQSAAAAAGLLVQPDSPEQAAPPTPCAPRQPWIGTEREAGAGCQSPDAAPTQTQTQQQETATPHDRTDQQRHESQPPPQQQHQLHNKHHAVAPPRDPQQPTDQDLSADEGQQQQQQRQQPKAAAVASAPEAHSSLKGRYRQPPRPGPRDAAAAGGPLVTSEGVLQEGFELCLILELCDAGSLRDLLARGGFRRAGDHGSMDLGALLDVATDVARAMSYLHAKSIVHADLKSRNVLLKSVSGNPAALGRRCGVVGKVSDFGLSLRIDNDATHVSNMFQGTAAFMAPELLLYGRVSKASDVYSFGILLWEMYTCGEAFKSVPKALLAAKVVEGLRPDFPPEVPPPYLRLAQQCWAEEPWDRPFFEQVVRELNCMRAALHGEPPPPPAQSLGSVTAQLRRHPGRSRSQLATRQLQPLAAAAPPAQQQQQLQERVGKAPPSASPHTPPLETILSTCNSADVEAVTVEAAAAAAASGGASRQPRLLPLLTEARIASQRRAADAAWAATTTMPAYEGPCRGDLDGGGGTAAANSGGAGNSGGDAGGAGAVASMMPAAALGRVPSSSVAGSSGALGVLQLQRLIENNLLVLGGCDGGSTLVVGLN